MKNKFCKIRVKSVKISRKLDENIQNAHPLVQIAVDVVGVYFARDLVRIFKIVLPVLHFYFIPPKFNFQHYNAVEQTNDTKTQTNSISRQTADVSTGLVPIFGLIYSAFQAMKAEHVGIRSSWFSWHTRKFIIWFFAIHVNLQTIWWVSSRISRIWPYRTNWFNGLCAGLLRLGSLWIMWVD